ncbi:hypothetical protein [Rossellomorea aquimaris]|uniref:hypothetical protein n=1 Tax=Rossellomorea aquimaris TaxID=189382 RepID=UPI0012E88874|nr:hypothetical protein [Rossellomorea aquimaris]
MGNSCHDRNDRVGGRRTRTWDDILFCNSRRRGNDVLGTEDNRGRCRGRRDNNVLGTEDNRRRCRGRRDNNVLGVEDNRGRCRRRNNDVLGTQNNRNRRCCNRFW